MNMAEQISITIKFFSGIDKDLKLEGYDPARGLSVPIKKGTRLRRVLGNMGVQKPSSIVYFRNGERIGLWTKLRDGDEVSCLRPSGGG